MNMHTSHTHIPEQENTQPVRQPLHKTLSMKADRIFNTHYYHKGKNRAVVLVPHKISANGLKYQK